MKHSALIALALAALLALIAACSADDGASVPTASDSIEVTAETAGGALTKEERIAAAENAPAQVAPESTVLESTAPEPTDTEAPMIEAPAPEPDFDLATDEGLCAADAELTNLELNDALAPVLGYPAEKEVRSFDQTEAIRAHKNEAFSRACPERMS